MQDKYFTKMINDYISNEDKHPTIAGLSKYKIVPEPELTEEGREFIAALVKHLREGEEK